MAITPTSTKSKQYQALGIDEIANDIETVFTAVNDLETEVNNLPAAPTTTTVNISSAQILSMGSSPIELLPAPGANKYYVGSIILEFDPNSVDYTFTDTILLITESNTLIQSLIDQGVGGGKKVVEINQLGVSNVLTDGGVDYPTINATAINKEWLLGTWNGTNPTLGNGTMRAIITYTERTFGA